MKLATCFLILGFVSIGLRGQAPGIEQGIRPGWAEYMRIVNGMSSLRVELVLDRKAYLPGERICSSLRIENPTSAPMQIFPPYGPASRASLSLYRSDEKGGWVASENKEFPISNDDSDGNAMANRETISLPAGYARKVAICLDGKSAQILDQQPVVGKLTAGNYRIAFEYERSALAEFSVVKASGSVGFSVATLPEYEAARNPKSGLPANCLGAGVSAFRTPETTAIVLLAPIAACYPASYENGMATAFSGFSRIAETDDGVNSLMLSRLPEGSLKVTWRDNRNSAHQVVLPRPELPER